jgi:hypothetical protein
MIKKSEIKKELVWNNDEDEAGERYVVCAFDDGSCLAITFSTDGDFERFGVINGTSHWSHHKPIVEKKMRYMDKEEALMWLVDHPKTLVRFGTERWKPAWNYEYIHSIENYEHRPMGQPDAVPQKFMVEDFTDD